MISQDTICMGIKHVVDTYSLYHVHDTRRTLIASFSDSKRAYNYALELAEEAGIGVILEEEVHRLLFPEDRT